MQLRSLPFILMVLALASPNACRASGFSKPLDVCDVKSENIAGPLILRGVLITDGEHYAILKSRNCPSYSLSYLMDVAEISKNSPSFWGSFAPMDSFAVGLRAYCVRVEGEINGSGNERFFLIKKVPSFKKLKVDPAGSLNVARVVCTI